MAPPGGLHGVNNALVLVQAHGNNVAEVSGGPEKDQRNTREGVSASAGGSMCQRRTARGGGPSIKAPRQPVWTELTVIVCGPNASRQGNAAVRSAPPPPIGIRRIRKSETDRTGGSKCTELLPCGLVLSAPVDPTPGVTGGWVGGWVRGKQKFAYLQLAVNFRPLS